MMCHKSVFSTEITFFKKVEKAEVCIRNMTIFNFKNEIKKVEFH